ncbi:unnamed protein product [Spirodela intermedia]|uniref:Probable magnesium transporter n=1 Tax=Spirodela intermedia TaxID=51605 RepID=A0A7I8JD72_SPIIN|nr:unnamed protein product [Spirodela intermedia]CAA6668108.1 unnamed protein product [Spirodela intermedia]
MGEWVVGAFINLFGSIRERLSVLGGDGSNRVALKPIIHFHTWRVGILFFVLGNCLNFISFGYAAQSLLAALGSVQFVSNIAFSYFVLSKMVTVKVMIATAFIVFGNVFLVSFGNHQSPVFTPEQLAEKYKNLVFLLYCLTWKGEISVSASSLEFSPYWHTLLPFSYAIVSGAVGSCSVLFAKSLSNMLRLTMSSSYHLHSWFTYSMFLLFLSTAGFWMARLNEGLSLFDAILIVPMFQISWTFFSICTGFVFDGLRTTMFVLGMSFVFIGISLLAPDDYSKGGDARDAYPASSFAQGIPADAGKQRDDDVEPKDSRLLWWPLRAKAESFLSKAKAACSLSLGLGEESMHASSVLVMPMVSSRTTGFRGTTIFSRARFGPLDEEDPWPAFSMDIIDHEPPNDATLLLPRSSSS